MAHRTADLHHIREARRPEYLTDHNTDQSTRAYEAIVRGDYKGARSRESGDNAQPVAEYRPRGLAAQDSADPRNQREPSPAMVRAGLQRTRVVPRILEEPCSVHAAAPREFCFPVAHGVCAERVKARAARP